MKMAENKEFFIPYNEFYNNFILISENWYATIVKLT